MKTGPIKEAEGWQFSAGALGTHTLTETQTVCGVTESPREPLGWANSSQAYTIQPLMSKVF